MRSVAKHELYAVIARRFAQGGIHACLWRDPDEFPRLVGFDMDVIVRPRCWHVARQSVESTLRDCGWHVLACIRRGTLHTILAMRNNGCASGDDFLQIDLHRFLTARTVPFVDLPPLFERAVLVDGAPFLSTTDGATVTMLEATLMGRAPKPRVAAAFEEATRAKPEQVAELLRRALGASALDPEVSGWNRGKAFFQALRCRPLTFAAVLWMIAWERLVAFLKPSGLVIAVSGPDGVGKSALIESLSKSARRKICLGVDVFHTRPFLLPPAALSPTRGDQVRRRARKTTVVISWMQLALALTDYWLGYWVRIRPRQAKGNLVIFDRHFLDYRVEPQIRGISLGGTVLRFASRFIPKVSLQVVLLARPETIVARKNELDFREASEQVDLYRRFASEYPDVLILETDHNGPDALAEQALCRTAALQGRKQGPLPEHFSPARAQQPAGEIDKSRRLRVLVSAYACDPRGGSEPGVGWNIARGLAERHDVWVITRANNSLAIDTELAKNPVPGLKFIYYDLPYWARFWKRGRRGTHLYYYLWQITARRVAAKAHAGWNFDIAHHVTFVNYWRPTFLAFLPIPFVWGPVGGRDDVPFPFWRGMGPRGIFYEILRWLGRAIGERDPLVRLAATRCAFALATTPRTRMRLQKLFERPVEELSQICFQPPQENGEDELSCLLRVAPPDDGVFRFVSVGNLLPLRGLHLGLEAFARSGLADAQYWIIGHGRERGRLERLAVKLGVAGRVKFHGQVPRGEVFRLLGVCQVLVHPALYESGGWACVEAMAAGRPVICLDLAGPATHVTSETGFKCRAETPEATVSEMAAVMQGLARDSALRTAMGRAARERVLQHYLVEHRVAYFSRCYKEAIERRSRAMQ